MKTYILVFAPYLLEGGYISSIIDIPFESIEDLLLYLKHKKYKHLDISFNYYSIEYTKNIPEWLRKCKIYNIFLSHHEFSIGWMLIETNEYEQFINHFKSLPVFDNVQYLDVTFDIKNNHLEQKDKEIIKNHYLEIGLDNKPVIKYYTKQLEYSKPEMLEHKETTNSKEIVISDNNTNQFESYYLKSKNVSFDVYDLYVTEDNKERYFVKRYYADIELTRKMIIVNEFLYEYMNIIIKHPLNYYERKDNYIYRFSKNIFEEKVENLFNSEYNFEPFDEEFLILNSILHYFHIGVASKPNLIKYKGDFYIFDIWGNLLLEYINYKPKINKILPEEKELLKKLENNNIEYIKERIYNKFDKVIDKKELEVVLNDCEKAVIETIIYIKEWM